MLTPYHVALLVALLAACGPDPHPIDAPPDSGAPGADAGPDAPGLAQDAPTPDVPPEEPDASAEPDAPPSHLVVSASPRNPLAAYASWETEAPLLVECAEYRATYAASPDGEVFVPWLYPGAVCVFAVGAEAVTLAVDPLEGWPVASVEGATDGWTLLNLSRADGAWPRSAVVVDELGRLRWVHRQSGETAHPAADVRTVSGGILVAGQGPGTRTSVISWEGVETWTAPEWLDVHHDARLLDDGRLLVIGGDHLCPESVYPDSVTLYDPETGAVDWEWHVCDHVTPPVVRQDWAHLNTVEPLPGGRVLVSARDLHTLYLLDTTAAPADALVWSLAGDWRKQHAPEMTPTGRILLFDNGDGGRAWSRLLEVERDEETGEAWTVWEYRPGLYADVYGDADRLPNGNTLGTFGLRGPDVGAEIHEVAPDGSLVWRLMLPDGWSTYRAERLPAAE